MSSVRQLISGCLSYLPLGWVEKTVKAMPGAAAITSLVSEFFIAIGKIGSVIAPWKWTAHVVHAASHACWPISTLFRERVGTPSSEEAGQLSGGLWFGADGGPADGVKTILTTTQEEKYLWQGQFSKGLLYQGSQYTWINSEWELNQYFLSKGTRHPVNGFTGDIMTFDAENLLIGKRQYVQNELHGPAWVKTDDQVLGRMPTHIFRENPQNGESDWLEFLVSLDRSKGSVGGFRSTADRLECIVELSFGLNPPLLSEEGIYTYLQGERFKNGKKQEWKFGFKEHEGVIEKAIKANDFTGYLIATVCCENESYYVLKNSEGADQGKYEERKYLKNGENGEGFYETGRLFSSDDDNLHEAWEVLKEFSEKMKSLFEELEKLKENCGLIVFEKGETLLDFEVHPE